MFLNHLDMNAKALLISKVAVYLLISTAVVVFRQFGSIEVNCIVSRKRIVILRKAFIFIIREIPCNSARLYNKPSAILARSCPFGVQMVTLRIKGGSALYYYRGSSNSMVFGTQKKPY